MSEITQLGYLCFEVSDLEAWERFTTKVLGVGISRRDDHGFTTRHDSYEHRLFISEGERDDLIGVGLQCADDAALDAVVARVREAGVDVVEGTPDECAHRDVQRMARFRDPGNIPVELVVGQKMAAEPFRSEVIASHFVADELGLGHCVIRAKDREVTERFWIDVLGFKLSDHIVCDLGGYKVDIAFLHTNPRHHSIAIGAGLPKRIHHFLLEVGILDDLGMAFDRTTDARLPVTQTIGRHPNDRMVSFYACTPSGFEFEYGWGGLLVDDATWETTTHDRISEWGHRRPPYPRPKS